MIGYRPRHAKPRYGIGDHRKFTPWRKRHYALAFILALALTVVAGGCASATAGTMRTARHCAWFGNFTVCVKGKPPRLFEIQCEWLPHHAMRCEERSS